MDYTFALLAGNPEAGEAFETEAPHLAGLRKFRVSRFAAHLVFYRPLPDGIDVVRVLHGARDVGRILETED